MANPDVVAFLEPIQQETATEMIARQLIDLISSGALERGDRLPSERQLAERFQVGRTTVREALKLLTLSGLLEARRGDGTYVRKQYWSFIAQQIRWPALLHSTEVNKLMEVRTSLEIQSARLAAVRVAEEELNRIEAVARELDELDERNVEFETEIDLRFHDAIAAATGNDLMVEVTLALREPLRKYIEQSNRMTADKSTTVEEHAAICHALREHDPEAAARAMRDHLDMSRFLALLGTDGQEVSSGFQA